MFRKCPTNIKCHYTIHRITGQTNCLCLLTSAFIMRSNVCCNCINENHFNFGFPIRSLQRKTNKLSNDLNFSEFHHSNQNKHRLFGTLHFKMIPITHSKMPILKLNLHHFTSLTALFWPLCFCTFIQMNSHWSQTVCVLLKWINSLLFNGIAIVASYFFFFFFDLVNNKSPFRL